MRATQRKLDESAINKGRNAQIRLGKVTERFHAFLGNDPDTLAAFERSIVAFEIYHASYMELISSINTGTLATTIRATYSAALLSERATSLEQMLVDNNVGF